MSRYRRGAFPRGVFIPQLPVGLELVQGLLEPVSGNNCLQIYKHRSSLEEQRGLEAISKYRWGAFPGGLLCIACCCSPVWATESLQQKLKQMQQNHCSLQDIETVSRRTNRSDTRRCKKQIDPKIGIQKAETKSPLPSAIIYSLLELSGAMWGHNSRIAQLVVWKGRSGIRRPVRAYPSLRLKECEHLAASQLSELVISCIRRLLHLKSWTHECDYGFFHARKHSAVPTQSQ
jgi:hypothetical protein